jgi:hypothetical protein
MKTSLSLLCLFIFSYTNSLNLSQQTNLSNIASNILGNINGTGSSGSSGITSLINDGSYLGLVTNTNNAATTLVGPTLSKLGPSVAGIATNNGLSTSKFLGIGQVDTKTIGNNSVSMGIDKIITNTNSQGANVMDVKAGAATSGTMTGTSSTAANDKGAATEKSTGTTLANILGNGVAATATNNTGSNIATDRLLSSTGISETGGLLSVNGGIGNFNVGSSESHKVTNGASIAGTSSSTNGSVTINGNGTGSTTSSSISSVSLLSN